MDSHRVVLSQGGALDEAGCCLRGPIEGLAVYIIMSKRLGNANRTPSWVACLHVYVSRHRRPCLQCNAKRILPNLF